uniref:Plant disease resistance WDH domain-containing protein n=1 Tax=Oryza punctata TaxID=4537 RepID=A0A0E0MGJ6_ORYPU
MAAWDKRINGGVQGFAAAASSSSKKEKGIRIFDVPAPPEIPRRRLDAFSFGVGDGDDGVVVEEEVAPSPLARARGCDVYVGYGGGAAAEVERFVAWLCAEMEALGVRCVAADRHRCRDAPSHAAARAAMDVAVAGVVVVTPASLGNPYCVDEIRAFVEKGRLVPVFVGLGKADCRAEDVVEKHGDLWGRFGGHLWKVYDGGERDWREAVGALSRADPAVEVDAGSQRHRLIDLLEIVGSRLGRRAVADAVRSWRAAAAAHPELPFTRNEGFVGRERELLDLESVLFGKRPMHLVEVEVFGSEPAFIDGVVCISGASGAGKTELVLEYAHRHAMEYKKVLWVRGEARYLRMGYLKLADQLGLAVGDDLSLIATGDRSSSGSSKTKKEWIFRGLESDAIAKIRKELTREIPYLLIIDNLESETDWWDSRDMQDLLPGAVSGAAARSHVIITTTRLCRLQRVRTFSLAPNLESQEAMLLMTKNGALAFHGEDTVALKAIQQKVGSIPLALALVGAVLSELAVSPAELRQAMNDAPYRAPTWEENDAPALRDNPGMVQLLDVCFALLDEEKDGLGDAAVRMIETSSFFAPSPIPVALLAAATGGEPKRLLWKQMKLALRLSCSSSRRALAKDSSRRRAAAAAAEPEALVALLRLGIARRCTTQAAPCVSMHRVFKLFGRKAVGSGEAAARSTVRAIAAAANAVVEMHEEHAWAACMSVFKIAPAVAANLPTKELPQFVTRVAVPITAHGVAAHSSYAAVTDLLVESSDAIRGEESRYVARGGLDENPSLYHELAHSRAQLMKMRAKLMLRGGEFTLAEDHSLAVIHILEVVAGDDDPETEEARAALDRVLQVQPEE